MEDVFISDLFELDEELEENGVFNSIINKDSHFFINILRLKKATTPEFMGSYERINDYFEDIMLLLSHTAAKDDKLYRETLKRFDFHGHNGINLGFSESGVDAGFGKGLSKKVINDAYEIVRSGTVAPEIFHLTGLFEENVAADRLSDMIATIIEPDVRAYTLRINEQLNITQENFQEVEFKDGIAINPFKNCELLYVPTEILHELPIAKCWDDIDRVISENRAIREEVNEVIGLKWYKMSSADKKSYLRESVFKDPQKCKRVLEGYRAEEIDEFSVYSDWTYLADDVFRRMKRDGVFNFLEHSDKSQISSMDAALTVLNIFRGWVENNKGWDEILSSSTQKREKTVQRLIDLAGRHYCDENNIDISFEPNEGPGPVDLKTSRGSKDKTVIEIKLSSNSRSLHGYKEQIETYAKSEGTDQRIFVYIQVEDHPRRDKMLMELHQKRIDNGENPPVLYIIDSRPQKSASKA